MKSWRFLNVFLFPDKNAVIKNVNFNNLILRQFFILRVGVSLQHYSNIS